MNRLIILLTLSGITLSSFGQDKWDLRRCVDFALKNNISVRQADVQARIVALTYEQSKLGQYPSFTFQNRAGYQFGRSIDPSTNLYTNQEILTTDHSLNLNLDLFNWSSKKNTVASN
ncbi:MAG TPA: TolC family protein, partial [Chitinophagaceae bacterium]|nr:TolC family protein [Chitinophagaceae bacterium]